MKCSPFSSQDLEVLTYLRALIPSTTYWCEDMMKMLVFLADKKAEDTLGRSLTTLDWNYSPVFKYLEATGLESANHWEQFVPDMGLLKSIKIRLTSPLSREQKRVLKSVARMKTGSEYRFGSIALRRKVFSFPRMPFTFPNVGEHLKSPAYNGKASVIALSDVEHKESNGRAEKPMLNCSKNTRLAE